MSHPIKCFQCEHTEFAGPYRVPGHLRGVSIGVIIPKSGFWFNKRADFVGFVCLNCGHVETYVTKQGLQDIHGFQIKN